MSISRNIWVCVILVCLALTAFSAAGEDGDAQLKVEMQYIRSEIADMRSQIQDLNKAIEQLTAEVRSLKEAPRPKVHSRAAQQPLKEEGVYSIDIFGDPFKGPSNAPVTIVEFFDIQCPYCVKEYAKLKDVLEAYPGKIKLVLKHFPLSFHKQAAPAHAAMVMAYQKRGNNGFWQMHDKIAEKPRELGIDVLKGYAEQLDLDMDRFNKIIEDKEEIRKLLHEDMQDAKKAGVRGTPSVFINGRRLKKRSIDNYKAIIDDILGNGLKKQ